MGFDCRGEEHLPELRTGCGIGGASIISGAQHAHGHHCHQRRRSAWRDRQPLGYLLGLDRGSDNGMTIYQRLRRLEKKSGFRIETDYLDWALADFSGYLAADELYDGPFCVLSVVDARRQRRLRILVSKRQL